MARNTLDAKFVCLWSIVWAVGMAALSVIANYLTPFLDPSVNNQWTPDIFYRLNVYFHGGIFLPLITALAALVYIVFKLDLLGGIWGKLLKIFILAGAITIPIGAIGGLFDLSESSFFGIPSMISDLAFFIATIMAVLLIIAMIIYPRASGRGYDKVGTPYYIVLFSVIGALIAGSFAYLASYIMVFGPSPPFVAQYINSTMYPSLGFYNDTAVITFTEGVITSHSHLMLPMVMAGIVGLIPAVYGYQSWSGGKKFLSALGLIIMSFGMVISIWIYLLAGLGNFSPPTLFASGPGLVNGIAADDVATGIIGFGALLVLIGLLLKGGTSGKERTLKDMLFVSLLLAFVLVFLTIPVLGYFIEFNNSYYLFAGVSFMEAYTRFHQDFGFFLLPALVVTVLIFEVFGISGKIRERVGYLYVSGEIIAFIFGVLYSMVTLSPVYLDIALFGVVLIALGALVGVVDSLRRTSAGVPPVGQTAVKGG